MTPHSLHTLTHTHTFSSPPHTLILPPVPPPQISPDLSAAYHGTTHTLTCTIIVDPSVDTSLNLVVVWSREGTALMDSDDSFTITQPALVSGSTNTYAADLTFTPLDQPSVSSGVYTCEVIAQPTVNTYIREASGSSDLILDVLGGPLH